MTVYSFKLFCGISQKRNDEESLCYKVRAVVNKKEQEPNTLFTKYRFVMNIIVFYLV